MHEGRSTWQKIRRFLRQAQCSLDEINRKVDLIMTKQEEFDAKITRLDAAFEGIKSDVAALKDQGVDVSALEARVAAYEGLDAENPAAETPPA